MCKKLVELPKDIHRQDETISYISEDLKPFKKERRQGKRGRLYSSLLGRQHNASPPPYFSLTRKKKADSFFSENTDPINNPKPRV